MNTSAPKLKTAQIGKCGELLVQYRLLSCGIESAHMTTDSGIDLVAYSSKAKAPITVQVKTNQRAKPGGGKGKDGLDWWIPDDCPAEYVALVDMSTDRVWWFSMLEIRELAQQYSSGRHHLYMYVDPATKPSKANRLSVVFEFERYRLENRVHAMFGI